MPLNCSFPLLRSTLLLLVLWQACRMSCQVPDNPLDVLVFHDGDRSSGELLRLENGSAYFRSYKTGESAVGLSTIQSLKSTRRFAVLRKGQPVTRANAIVGLIEVKEEAVFITPESGPVIRVPEAELQFAVDDATFEREVLHHTRLHEGWSTNASIGASLVRSTEAGTAINGDLLLSRALPGVDYLPRRNRTELRLTEYYELLSRHYTGAEATIETESNIFHAGIERNEFFHERFYGLANYNFDRNFAQGLLAQHVIGAGLGLVVLKNYPNELEIKTGFTRNSQDFVEPEGDDVLLGQRIGFDFRRFFPANLSLSESADYLPSYNLPHRYSANSVTTLFVPLFRHFGLSLTATDNYLNNPSFGNKRNSLRVATSLTYYH